jgi:inner membrane protein
MPSAISHALVGAAVGVALRPERPMPARFWPIAMACSVLPDTDVVGYWLGMPYDAMFGHRGISHSITMALALAALVTWVCFASETWRGARLRLWLCFFVATASHGILDAMTTGGRGIAFFAPFSSARYFLPWRPIEVSPLSPSRFFTSRGLDILASEALWVWLPALALAGIVTIVRVQRQSSRDQGQAA